eukprot:362859-Chlamydomonas_euryale.AAC.2
MHAPLIACSPHCTQATRPADPLAPTSTNHDRAPAVLCHPHPQLVEHYAGDMRRRLQQVIGHTLSELDGRFSTVRSGMDSVESVDGVGITRGDCSRSLATRSASWTG